MSGLTVEEREALHLRHLRAAERMQAGVALMMNYNSKATEPKHLRIGVNTALSDHGGLAYLLVRKGVITEREYLEAICDMMEREAADYERRCQNATGNTQLQLSGTLDTVLRGEI